MSATLPVVPREPGCRKPKSACRRGHAFTPENTIQLRNGHRACRTCDRMRKEVHYNRTRATRERQVEVACPLCKRLRMVVATTAKRLQKMPHACFSCARKAIRKGMAFKPATCVKCGATFAGRSGAARFCDTCARRKPIERKTCGVCGAGYVGYKGKTACSQACLRRIRVNKTYFGGRMFEAKGWADKICQLCERHVPKKAHVHHVFAHPNHSALVVLCAGCHDVVSILARRPTFGETQFMRLRWYALAQRLGRDPNHGEGEAPRVEVTVRELLS